MKVLITDSRLSPDTLELEIDDDQDDVDEPEVTEEEAELLLDWWNDVPGRNYQVLEDGGYIVTVNTDEDSGIPMIGVWAQEMSDTTWPLRSFPFASLSWEVQG